jgi:imidazole glycerol-phosphate synthase subunit HisH
VSKITVGIVDYGVGNHSSVRHSLHELGLRCRTTDATDVLDTCDILVLPGVGAFRPAMQALKERSLDGYVQEQADRGRPLLGICLGMQLFAQASQEAGFTQGLGLIPGEVVPLGPPHWHIGWNTLEQVQVDPLFHASDGRAFYFNHSYAYRGPSEYQVCRTRAGGESVVEEFGSVIRKGKVVGVQFHPEKSQDAGRSLLQQLIRGLCDA